MFRDLTLLTMAGHRMDWTAKRQEVLAENVANLDTPGYTPRDVKEFNFRGLLEEAVPLLKVKRTSESHLTPPLSPSAAVQANRRSYEVAPDKNGVVLEEQMVALGESDDFFDLSANIYDKQYKMMRLSISKRDY